MKNTIKLIGIIAITAIIGLSMVTCGDPGSGGGGSGVSPSPTPPPETSITYTSFDTGSGATYELLISSLAISASVLSNEMSPNENIAPAIRASTLYTPKANDNFRLRRTLGGSTQEARGTIANVSGTGATRTFSLQQGNTTSNLTVSGDGITSIPTGLTLTSGSGTMDTPTGQLVATSAPTILHFSNMQVHTLSSQKLVPFEGSKEIKTCPEGGIGSIIDGKLNFIIGEPASEKLGTIENFFYDEIWNETVSPAGIKGARLRLHTHNYEHELHYVNITQNGNDLMEEYFAFSYVASDCTINIPAASYSNDQGATTINRQQATLQLKKGWNIVSVKFTGTIGVAITEVISVVNALPAGSWIMEEYYDCGDCGSCGDCV